MKTITIHIDKKLLKQCKRLAKQRNITLNQLIVEALEEFIQKAENDRQI